MKFFKRNRKDKKGFPDDESEEFTDNQNASRFASHQPDERENVGFVSPTNTHKAGKSFDLESIQNKSSKNQESGEDYALFIEGEPVYVVKQKRGYMSIFFCLAQTAILVGMMIQCGVAPMRINPMVGPYPDALSYWGGKNSYDILYDGEYWRLFSPVMLHAGIFHLLCNVAVQLDTGAFFEREWGWIIWLAIYMGSAAAGSILSVIVSPNSIGVGSSGAVCGLFGGKIAEALCRCKESTKTDTRELSYAILCEQFATTLISVILILGFSFIPFVDWAAHVGGLLGGFMIGMLIFSLQIKSMRWKIGMFSFGLLSNLIFFGTGAGYMIKFAKQDVAMEMSDVCGYYEQFFEDYECNCQLENEND